MCAGTHLEGYHSLDWRPWTRKEFWKESFLAWLNGESLRPKDVWKLKSSTGCKEDTHFSAWMAPKVFWKERGSLGFPKSDQGGRKWGVPLQNLKAYTDASFVFTLYLPELGIRYLPCKLCYLHKFWKGQ